MTSTDLVLDVVADVGGDIAIVDAIVGGELERTIEGASTLTIDVHDPHRLLIRSSSLSRAIDLQYAGVWFRLVKIAKSGDTVTLTFEDRDVAYLRTHRKARKVSRNTMTRAQFVRSLVREVKENRIEFFSPEVNERQPIGKSSEDAKPRKRTTKDRDTAKQKGLASGARLTVKGENAGDDQRRNGERCLDVADTLKAGAKATKALIVAVIQESQIQNLSYGHSSSVGILQLLDIHGSVSLRRDVEYVVRLFLTKGFTGKGGAMELARAHPSWDAADVAATVQGNAQGARDYRPWLQEADRWLGAYGGASGTDSGGTTDTTVTRKKYEFARGVPGKSEDSWTAIQRLATEVQWRAFMDAGTLYFISEDRLLAARARYVISEDDDGINGIDFDIDQGKVSGEVRVSVRTEVFDIPVGSVVAIEDMGICNGRWLVATVRQPLFEAEAEVTLKALTPKLPEPAPESITKTTEHGAEAAAEGEVSRNSVVAKCYRFADSVDKKNYAYSWGGGHLNFQGPYDCSGFVSAILHAGRLLEQRPFSTVDLINWGELGEGKFMTVWVKENGNAHQSHTFVTFELQGAGKGKQEFAEAGGGDSSHTGWHSPRNKSGFVPRHWPGT
jgi:hypothetical protein